ncbi:MAG: hypothetical protein JOY93_08315 [Acidobacteriales bacterium]|nr:hypothetical protein [Terriglobales bacterium]
MAISVNRLWLAFAAYVLLAILAGTTISDRRIRLATLAVLAMFALKTYLRRRDAIHPEVEADGSDIQPM